MTTTLWFQKSVFEVSISVIILDDREYVKRVPGDLRRFYCQRLSSHFFKAAIRHKQQLLFDNLDDQLDT